MKIPCGLRHWSPRSHSLHLTESLEAQQVHSFPQSPFWSASMTHGFQPWHKCFQWIRINTKQGMPFSKGVPGSSAKFGKIVEPLSHSTRALLRLSQEISRWKSRGYYGIWGTHWFPVATVTFHDEKFFAASHGKFSKPFIETEIWAE